MLQQDLIKTILIQADKFEWTTQGLGMLRLYLGGSTESRLHIWHNDLRAPEASEIHDHPWGFVSHVICGGILNHKYEFLTDGIRYLSEPYTRGEIFCGEGGGLTGNMTHGLLFKKAESEYYSGDSYSQQADEIHRTEFVDGTLTLITRRFGTDVDHAHVFWKIGSQFVSAEPRTATPEEVKLATQAALELMAPRMLVKA